MSSNWVKLNVGGQLFQTTLTTLLSSSDSILAKMFDPESGFAPPYSENGVYFLDADPKYFAVILNWLRYGEIMLDADINPRNVAKVADYFGLEKLVKEIREIGAVVIKNDGCEENKCSMGLYLKQADNSYRQAGGKMYLYQAPGGVWYINDTLMERAGRFSNDISKESHILPRTEWEYWSDDDKWKDANLNIIDSKDFMFCNVITVSSTKYKKKEFLGEFRRVSEDWLNGWQVYKNKEGKYLFPTKHGFWCIKSNRIDEDLQDNGHYAIGSHEVTSCPAHDQSEPWQYWDTQRHFWMDDETFKVSCDVHK